MKWTEENQALWVIFKSTIRAFKISGWLTLEQEEEFINKLQEIIESKEKVNTYEM